MRFGVAKGWTAGMATVVCAAVIGSVVSAAAGAAAEHAPVPTAAPPPNPFGLVPKGPKAARHIALETAAYQLISDANQRLYKVKPLCRPTFHRPSSKITHDAPVQPTLDAVAALRRPAQPADALPHGFPAPSYGETYVDYTRVVTSASGKAFYLVVARNTPVAYRPTDVCLDTQHTQLLKLVGRKPPLLRVTALREFRKLRRDLEDRPTPSTTPQDALFLFSKGPSGGGGGGGSIGSFMKYGLFMSSSRAGNATLTGLVPDGVATVTLEYPKRASRGRWYKPVIYRSAYTRTVRVQQNVLVVHVPRGAGDALAPRMIWRSADGKVVRVVKRPGL